MVSKMIQRNQFNVRLRLILAQKDISIKFTYVTVELEKIFLRD